MTEKTNPPNAVSGPDMASYSPPSDKAAQHYATLSADHSADAIAMLDPDLRVLWINPGFERLIGYGLDHVLGKRLRSFLQSDHADPNVDETFERNCRSMRPFVAEHQYRHKDGHEYWMENWVTPIFAESGKPRYFLCNARETTARRTLRQQHERSILVEKTRQKERRLLSQVSEWLYSAKSIEELVKVVNLSLKTLIPEASGQLFAYSHSRDVLDLIAHWNGAENQSHIDPDDCWSLRRGRAYSYGGKSIEFPCHHVSVLGQPYFCLPIVAHGQTNGLLHIEFKHDAFAGMTPDQRQDHMKQRWQLALLCAEQISLSVANVQLRQELLDQSVRDPLTNLWNRRWLLEAAHKEMQNATRSKKPFSLMSIDVDHFKQFNDQHGHDAGDLVLRSIGNTMMNFFGTDASACRMGGEEFLVLCPDMNAEESAFLAEQFRKKVHDATVNYGGAPLPKVTVSIGVASYPRDAAQIVDLMNAADRAMYRAKEAGRDTVVVFEAEPTPRRAVEQS